MKRFTLIFNPQGESATTDQVKSEVEQVLLRLHPSITYRIWQMYRDVDGKELVEIAVDGKRKLVEEALRQWAWKTPMQFEKMSWGWLIDDQDIALHTGEPPPGDNDPLAVFEPGSGETIIIPRMKKWVLRYITLLLSTLILLILLIGTIFTTETLLVELIFVAVFFVWMVSLNQTPLDFRVYTKKITCGQDSLEVEYWFLKKPQQMAWREVTGMDYTNPVCTISSPGQKMRFLLSRRFGCAEKNIVLKTMVNRASLRYVEGNFIKQMYRKDEPATS